MNLHTVSIRFEIYKMYCCECECHVIYLKSHENEIHF